jgi:lipoprotein-anchoring transpeptidase ErfK/SrfK
MGDPISRRAFLRLALLSCSSLALRSFGPVLRPDFPEYEQPLFFVRVTINSIYLYQEPDFQSERVGTAQRDELLPVYEVIRSPNGPGHNPRWYHLPGGFSHSAYLQKVKSVPNIPLNRIPTGGQLGEISVPYTRARRYSRTYGWQPLYRLYYGSVHWITSLEEGPGRTAWYGLMDELLHVEYFVPAAYVRPIQVEELSPISVDCPPEDKRIEVSIKHQTLTAYEGEKAVLQTKVSSGVPTNGPSPNDIPTDTPTGHFRIQVKVPSKHMGDGELTSDINAYELVGVPWVSFFHQIGVALHGTFWHDNFGRRMSHGCVNLRNEDAKWIYRWSHPVAEPGDWNRKGLGTRIRVI